jgi:predicted Zn-dependent protease
MKYASPLAMASLAAVLTAPLSHAEPALDACIQAFVQSTLPPDQPVKIRKMSDASSPLDTYGATREVLIDARITRTGQRIAQATCTVNWKGEVIALNGAPYKQRIATALDKSSVR